jgi:lipopolysaccharide transport system permease protein
MAILTTALEAAPRSRTLIYYRDLVLVLLAKELKVRYKSTFIGYAWSVMHPLVMALTFFVVFGVVLRLEIEAYALYLISGLFAWQWIANAAASANFFFLGNGTLIKKVRFPRAALVVAGVLNEACHFVASVPIVLAFMWHYGRSPRLDWLWLAPSILAVQLLMTFGLALLIATSNLFFRDLERMVTLGVHLLFYLTPIVYAAAKIPPAYRWILFANPFAALILCWQGLFYGPDVSARDFGVALSWALALAAGGLLAYAKNVWRFAEVV